MTLYRAIAADATHSTAMRRSSETAGALRRESIRNSFAIQNVWKTVTLLHRMQRSYVFCSRENSKSVAATGRHRRYPWFRASPKARCETRCESVFASY